MVWRELASDHGTFSSAVLSALLALRGPEKHNMRRIVENDIAASRLPMWSRYGIALALQAVLVLLLIVTRHMIPLSDFPAPFAATLMATAYLLGEGPAVFSFLIGLIDFRFFFIQPYDEFTTPADIHGWTSVLAYLIINITVLFATSLLHRRNEKLLSLAKALQERAGLIDLSPDALFVQDADTGRIMFWSHGAERTYGYARLEALGRVAQELLHTQYPVSREHTLGELAVHYKWEGDLIHQRKDGSKIIAASRWAMQRDANRPVILEVARDVTHERRRQNEFAEEAAHSKRIAEVLQRSLLISPTMGRYPGLAVDAIYHGAEDDLLVGGDFFDIFPLSGPIVAFVVGDAAGKGLKAASVTAEVKFVLRGYLYECEAPSDSLRRLNEYLVNRQRMLDKDTPPTYVVVSVALLNVQSGSLRMSSAGSDLPCITGHPLNKTNMVAGGLPLGVAPHSDYEEKVVTMAQGEMLVMTTDGLTEARHPQRRGDFLGIEGVVKAVEEEMHRQVSVLETAKAVAERARRFAGGTLDDDVCLLLAKRVPAAKSSIACENVWTKPL
ncbi:MAG: SpoIIE family protein phosphatase [Capsulimonadaceae bacterium]|nr:SpoIIE family protein phosphatase [Capsulimonadaceae bacterium]